MTKKTNKINILDNEEIDELTGMRKKDYGLIQYVLNHIQTKKEQISALLRYKKYHEEEQARLETLLVSGHVPDYVSTKHLLQDYKKTVSAFDAAILEIKTHK